MKLWIHAAAGAIALITVSAFWLSTATVEVLGDAAAITMVKACVLAGMAVLIPAMIVAGASGLSLGRGWKSPAVAAKKRRMRIIAANGLLVLMPSAFLLNSFADAGRFDTLFTIVQAIELIAGAVNITLLSLNMRDGLSLRRKPLRPAAQAG
ncbi:hypothetical protein EN829_025450 [Mesorhizobium sp. M00.F.Ca.ET.186.01.1.1]|nr:hypothetical protein EN848_24620 [bacterium M00.F.Ca.ET.205.01.1.1]TGU49185.1 hypothetical protein EN795_25900 [bacterium M00.F.Ca.ET.152.01.1.1]TGV32926.1 hypothetical protein EN829_025450 [Mesorhizobium sp. M00.F.Ca.ET.186.01.1.1]TGZ40163.1 hypothetical protein EN805_25295 [bacterium M00.F.Ca.ET.162.01.1.1]